MDFTYPIPKLPWKTAYTIRSVLEATISTELFKDSPEIQTWRGKDGRAAKWTPRPFGELSSPTTEEGEGADIVAGKGALQEKRRNPVVFSGG